jgi:hypothetical protein
MNAETETFPQTYPMSASIVSGDSENFLIHDTENDWTLSKCGDATAS